MNDRAHPALLDPDRYWGAQTQRSPVHFAIDGELDEHFPLYVWQTGSGIVNPRKLVGQGVGGS
jgi:fumarate hydratase class II